MTGSGYRALLVDFQRKIVFLGENRVWEGLKLLLNNPKGRGKKSLEVLPKRPCPGVACVRNRL